MCPGGFCTGEPGTGHGTPPGVTLTRTEGEGRTTSLDIAMLHQKLSGIPWNQCALPGTYKCAYALT